MHFHKLKTFLNFANFCGQNLKNTSNAFRQIVLLYYPDPLAKISAVPCPPFFSGICGCETDSCACLDRTDTNYL